MPISSSYFLKRAILALAVVVGVAIVSYVILMVTPGDPAAKWAGNPRGPGASKAIETARQELGLDQPIYVQALNFVIKVLSGNIGISIAYKIPVSRVIYTGFMSTLELLIVTYAFSAPLGVFLGLYASLRRGSFIDSFVMSLGALLASTPTFWLATMILTLLLQVGFVPYGRVSPGLVIETGFKPITGFILLDSLLQRNLVVFADALIRLIPAALAVSVYPIGALARLVRILVAEALLEDYVKAAVAWGIKRSTIIKTFVLRSITPSIVQVAGLSFAYSLVDAMVVEAVFGREGLGSILLDSLYKSDFRVAIGLIAYLSVFYIVVNTLVDLLQAHIDPRVKL